MYTPICHKLKNYLSLNAAPPNPINIEVRGKHPLLRTRHIHRPFMQRREKCATLRAIHPIRGQLIDDYQLVMNSLRKARD